jgi:hypothetical protein
LHRSSPGEQQTHDLWPIRRRRDHQWRDAFLVCSADLRPGIEQYPHDLGMPLLRGGHQRCEAIVIRQIRRRPGLEEEDDRFTTSVECRL